MAKKITIYPTGKVFVDGVPAVEQSLDETEARALCEVHCGDDYAFSLTAPDTSTGLADIDKEV